MDGSLTGKGSSQPIRSDMDAQGEVYDGMFKDGRYHGAGSCSHVYLPPPHSSTHLLNPQVAWCTLMTRCMKEYFA